MRRTPREKSRNLTDSEMARWREYFEGLVASEHTAMEERAREEREFTSDVMAHVIAELRENIEADTQQALDALMGMRLGKQTGGVRPSAPEKARPAAQPPFGLPPEGVGAVSSRVPCEKAGKTQIFSPFRSHLGNPDQ